VSPAITLKDKARESALLRNRAITALLVVLALAGVLVARLVYLQIIAHVHFATLSENNRVKIVPIPPTRGLIYDRNGVLLAQNLPSFSLEVVPEAVEDMEATLEGLSRIVSIREADLDRFRKVLRRKRPFESIPLRFHLNDEEVARFAVNRHRFPGVDIEARLTRHYPLGATTAPVVGYVGRIDEQELQYLDAANYSGSSHVGKTGVEKAYEDVLHGRVGYKHVETNAQGRTLRVLARSAPVPGHDLEMNIDVSLQAAAEKALGEENGAVVAIDPETGGVLALVSTPSYDPNLFVNGIDAQEYAALQASPNRPLFNRALRGQYPPGSTVKPFVALAGLDADAVKPEDETWCRGWYQLPGASHRYRDWKRSGHGHVDLNTAIKRSCDVYFYELALELGIDRLNAYMTRFGFGQKTGVDIGGEVSGLMPSRDWKRRARSQPWYPGETLITGIGQGFTLATPLQLATATASLAMHGSRLTPRVVHAEVDPESGARTVLKATTLPSVKVRDDGIWTAVIQGMVDVVHDARGTARRIGLDAPYQIAGKTGTAQVFSVGQEEKYDAAVLDKRLRDHALFIAFAPARKPRIAVAVLVENGGSGSGAAAPIARKVMDHYLLSQGVES
jgi:penicillin-binding protein 2